LDERQGRAVKSDYIGKKVPRELRDRLAERFRLTEELPRVREGLRLLRSAPGEVLDLSAPLLEIFRALTRQNRN